MKLKYRIKCHKSTLNSYLPPLVLGNHFKNADKQGRSKREDRVDNVEGHQKAREPPTKMKNKPYNIGLMASHCSLSTYPPRDWLRFY